MDSTYSCEMVESGFFLGTIDFNGDGISAWVALDERFETVAYITLWLEFCSSCDIMGDEWDDFLEAFDLFPEYGGFVHQSCSDNDDPTCRYSFLDSDSVTRSLGYELYAEHFQDNSPKISFGIFEGEHSAEDPMFKSVIAADISADGNNELLLFSKTKLEKIYYNFTPSYSSGSITYSYDTKDYNTILSYRTQLGDYNGDGIIELIMPSSEKKLSFSAGKPGYLVTSITNGLGIQSRFTYQPLTDNSVYNKEEDADFPVIDFIAPWYVVSSISSDNGVADSVYLEYDYHGAKIHLQGKGFLGFMETTVTNELLNTSQIRTMDYDTIFYHPYPVSALQKSGSNNTQQSTTYTSIDNLDSKEFRPITDSIRFQDYLSGTITTESFLYNNDGLVSVREIDFDDDATITNKYIYTKAGWHVASLPQYLTTEYKRGSTMYDSTFYFYDSGTGNLIQKKEYCGTDLELTTKYQSYDSYGNPHKTIVIGKRGSNLAIDSVETTISYSDCGRFITSKSGPLNFKESFEYDVSNGLLESKTESNRLTKDYEYGSFNILKKKVYPDLMEEVTNLTWCTDQTESRPTGALFYQWKAASGSPPVKIFYDGMGRELRKATVGFGGDSIYMDTEYDSKGRVTKKSMPYFSTDEPSFTTYVYDSYGRISSDTSPRGIITSYSYSNLQTDISVSNESETLSTSRILKNAIGERIENEDNIGNIGSSLK